jgi:hypothetical protein
MATRYNRRKFIRQAAAIGGAVGLSHACPAAPPAADLERLKPIGEAKGIHPGRVVWVHDPKVTDWTGPGDGRWYENDRTKQERVDAMMAQAVGGLTGEPSVAKAWDKLFRHLNRGRGKGDVGYRSGEAVVIKPNWVGMIWREATVNPETVRTRRLHSELVPEKAARVEDPCKALCFAIQCSWCRAI